MIMRTVYMRFVVILLFASSTLITSQTIVKTLPGYAGPLPFKLETGYIGVGEDDDVQLFYFFVESEGNPDEDPLIIWLAGGPGCSNLHAFLFEIGPLKVQNGDYIDGVPPLELDPNSWTKLANIIYLDGPALTGYSYTTTLEAAHTSDTLSATQTVEFIRKFIRDHPKFVRNPMYVTGVSYSGIVIPIITEELYKGNEEGLLPVINVKGYMVGNPLTDKSSDINSRLEYVYRMALISEELFESTATICHGEYGEADPNNFRCMLCIDEVNKRVSDISLANILDRCCYTTSLVRSVNPVNPIRTGTSGSLSADPITMIPSQSYLTDTSCYAEYSSATFWANDKNVMKALNVLKGRANETFLCNVDMSYSYGESSKPLYDFNILSSVVYHEKLSKRNCRALIFSGDHDMTVPHVGTRTWINSLNLTITDSNWDAWYTNDGQVGGFKTTYAHNNYSLVFATVKGGSHTAPQNKPLECFEMVQRWFTQKPI